MVQLEWMTVMVPSWSHHMEKILPLVTKPTRYLGGEIGSVRKDLTKVGLKIALAFPDTYELGMSHLGFRIIYGVLNVVEEVAAERFFVPWPDMEMEMVKRGIPLLSQESKAPLNFFDVIAFSIPYEMGYSNVLHILKMGGIPLLASERKGPFPLVIAGGPFASNPEPMAMFLDAVVLGDGEEVALELVEVLLEAKRKKWAKREILEALSQIEGVYVPSFFQPLYCEDGTLEAISPLVSGYQRVRRRIVPRLPSSYPEGTSMVPHMEIVHDRATVEIARGCTRGCRFCQAGFIYRPVRERPLEEVCQLASTILERTGYEELSLLSLSSGDYSRIEQLVEALSAIHSGAKIALSFPSLRVGSISDRVLSMIREVRKTGITIAPEAGTERLRRVINKDVTEEEVLDTAERVFAQGWLSLKLYFMIGLPTEGEEDLAGIVKLCQRIVENCRTPRGRPRLAVGLSTFVPKPHTPFQWATQLSLEDTRMRLEWLKRELRKIGAQVKWQQPELSLLEGAFSRGDRRLGNVLLRAHEKGCKLDGWSEHLRFHLWLEAFEEEGLPLKDYATRAFSTIDVLPWDHLDMGVEKGFLLRELERALNGERTEDCRWGECAACGACKEGLPDHVLASEREARLFPGMRAFWDTHQRMKSKEVRRRFRLRYAKMGPARFLGHLELASAVMRAMRRARIPMAFTEGHHPMPKVDLGPGLPLGVQSQAEFMEVETRWWIDPAETMRLLNRELPEGVVVMECQEVPIDAPSVFRGKARVTFEVEIPEGMGLEDGALESRLNRFLDSKTWVINRKAKDGGAEKRVDLRKFVLGGELKGKGSLVLHVEYNPSGGFRLLEVISAVLGVEESRARSLEIVKKEVEFTDSISSSKDALPDLGEERRKDHVLGACGQRDLGRD